MKVSITNTGKKFVFDKASFIVTFNNLNFWKTSMGNIVRENIDGSFTEISKVVAEANILLMPFDIAFELFPTNEVFNETI